MIVLSLSSAGFGTLLVGLFFFSKETVKKHSRV